MLQLALLEGDESCFLSIFLCSGEQCLGFCLKLESAVRTDSLLVSTKTPEDGDLQQVGLNWVIFYIQNRIINKLNTSGLRSLSCAV